MQVLIPIDLPEDLAKQVKEIIETMPVAPITTTSIPIPAAAPTPAEHPGTLPVADVPPCFPAPPPDVDGKGIPWDARIHSSNKTITSKGVWAKRRGVDGKTFNTIQAELLAAGNAPAPAAPAPAPAAPAPAAPAPAPAAPAPAPAAPAPAAGAGAGAVPGATLDWPEVMRRLTNAQMAGTYDEPRMKQLLEHWGVTHVSQLISKPETWQIMLDDEALGL